MLLPSLCNSSPPPPRTPSCVSVKSTTPFWRFYRCDFLYKNPQTQAKNCKIFLRGFASQTPHIISHVIINFTTSIYESIPTNIFSYMNILYAVSKLVIILHWIDGGFGGRSSPRKKNAILGNEQEILLNDMFVLGIWLSARPTLFRGVFISFFLKFSKTSLFRGGVLFSGGFLFHNRR